MKLSLDMEVGKSRTAKKAAVYPTKRTINLVPQKKGAQWSRGNVIAAVVGVVLILVFAKFAVVDVLSAAAQKNAQLYGAQQTLAGFVEENSDYIELQKEAARYGAGGLSAEERSLVPRGDVLTLLNRVVGNRTDVVSVSVSESTIQIRFANTALHQVSNVVASLEASPLVQKVEVSTAQSETGSNVISTVLVTLVGGTAEQTDAGSSESEGVNNE